MALIDEVKLRRATQKLVEWTNPETREATTIDDTWLGTVCDDVEAEFLIYHGTPYDGTNRAHVLLAVEGVEIRLKMALPKASDALTEDLATWQKKVMDLAATDPRNRILPTTDQFQNVSDDTQRSRPAFDRRRFNGIRPR